MDDLVLVSTEELVEELKRRYDTIAFLGIKNLTKNDNESKVYWNGNICEVSLLGNMLLREITDEFYEH